MGGCNKTYAKKSKGAKRYYSWRACDKKIGNWKVDGYVSMGSEVVGLDGGTLGPNSPEKNGVQGCAKKCNDKTPITDDNSECQSFTFCDYGKEAEQENLDINRYWCYITDVILTGNEEVKMPSDGCTTYRKKGKATCKVGDQADGKCAEGFGCVKGLCTKECQTDDDCLLPYPSCRADGDKKICKE